MFACLRISRAPLTHAYRAFSTAAPLRNANTTDEPAEAMRRLADLVQSAAEEQGKRSRPPSNPVGKTKANTAKPGAPPLSHPHEFTRENRITKPYTRRKEQTMGPSRAHAQSIDAFRKLSIDPLDEFKNPLLLKPFVTDMGKIHSRAKTGLTWRSQRRVGKAIRRARAMGFVPLWSSPEVYDGFTIVRSTLPDWTRTSR
ncbi:Ribosomal protein S18 [Rhizoctonia solani]|uniref:Small ribosomal subunit protein bS18m n=1 Tax=Rhizoctonia solani TaxID=456999 RepID=A0A8H7IHY9_9AGAM|nr:Ribosomal protein S18 [Rhizoctonia solani]